MFCWMSITGKMNSNAGPDYPPSILYEEGNLRLTYRCRTIVSLSARIEVHYKIHSSSKSETNPWYRQQTKGTLQGRKVLETMSFAPFGALSYVNYYQGFASLIPGYCLSSLRDKEV
jgi:hypothetical protein